MFNIYNMNIDKVIINLPSNFNEDSEYLIMKI